MIPQFIVLYLRVFRIYIMLTGLGFARLLLEVKDL